MAGERDEREPSTPGDPPTVEDLARQLRHLRRRQARSRSGTPVTYRELAARTGWALGVVSDYFSGKVLPPTDRFDVLVRLLGGSPDEQRTLAALRDQVEERRRVPAGSPPAAPGAAPARGVPRQLPPSVRHFEGRAVELAALTRLAERAGEPGTSVALAAIDGAAGVGKTALAVHWAHQAADRFPDGQLYANLRAFGPSRAPLPLEVVVRGFLEAFGMPHELIPAGLDAQAGLFRSLLAGRRVLVVLDNASDADQVRPLLPATPGCMAVVTSRYHLVGLISAEGAHPITLDLLTGAEAGRLLVRRLGADRVAAEPGAVEDIIALCGRLPLALALVAGRAAAHAEFRLAAIADELRDVRYGLDAFSAGEPTADLRAVFSWSYERLDPTAQRLFRLLAMHPGPEVGTSAAASLAGEPLGRVRSVLAELARANLVAEREPNRFVLHDLLRAYAMELCASVDPPDERHRARLRLFDHVLHTACAAYHLLVTGPGPIELEPPQPGVTVTAPADRREALSLLGKEQAVLRATVDEAAANGFDAHAWRLAAALAPYLARHGSWHEQVATQRTALAAAARAGSAPGQAEACHHLGLAEIRLGRYEQAREHLEEAARWYGGDRSGRGRVECSLARSEESQGRYPAALGHAQAALKLCRAAGDQGGQAHALTLIGWYQTHLGEHQRAIVNARRGLALYQRVGDPYGEADTLHALGYICQNLGDPAAIRYYQRALELFRDNGDRFFEADTLTRLGDTYDATGESELARGYRRAALAILDELRAPEAERVQASLGTQAG